MINNNHEIKEEDMEEDGLEDSSKDPPAIFDIVVEVELCAWWDRSWS